MLSSKTMIFTILQDVREPEICETLEYSLGTKTQIVHRRACSSDVGDGGIRYSARLIYRH